MFANISASRSLGYKNLANSLASICSHWQRKRPKKGGATGDGGCVQKHWPLFLLLLLLSLLPPCKSHHAKLLSGRLPAGSSSPPHVSFSWLRLSNQTRPSSSAGVTSVTTGVVFSVFWGKSKAKRLIWLLPPPSLLHSTGCERLLSISGDAVSVSGCNLLSPAW